jgi:hypothetical protein
VNVQVVSSSRPVATQKNPPQTSELQRGKTVTLDGASSDAEWINPFPGKSLSITDAKAQSAPAGVTVTHTGSSITVSAASGAAIGAVNIVYHVQDATKDPKRTASAIGQYRVTIHDVPSKPKAPDNARATDGQATVEIAAPANNGKPIDQYEVSGGPQPVTVTDVGTVTITGLTNGTSYAFAVRAHNADGWGELSPQSASVTPYGTPAKVSGATIAAGQYAPQDVRMSWNALSGAAETGGGSVTYHYSLNGGGWVDTKNTSATANNQGVGTYSFEVYATNDGSGKAGPHASSNSVRVDKKPDPQPSVTLRKGDLEPGYTHSYTYDVTINHFAPNRTFTISFYCPNKLSSEYPITSDGNGSGHYRGKPDRLHPWCGFEGAHVIVNGVQSNVEDWSP